MVFSITNPPAVRCIPDLEKQGFLVVVFLNREMPLPSGLETTFCFHNNERENAVDYIKYYRFIHCRSYDRNKVCDYNFGLVVWVYVLISDDCIHWWRGFSTIRK